MNDRLRFQLIIRRNGFQLQYKEENGKIIKTKYCQLKEFSIKVKIYILEWRGN